MFGVAAKRRHLISHLVRKQPHFFARQRVFFSRSFGASGKGPAQENC
jgi:hypothetical protein